jgi:hypothetical protein
MNLPGSNRLVEEGEIVARDKYNDGYTHEVLHLASVLEDTWGRHIVDTRCAEEFSDVRAAAEAISDMMQNFYQLVGSKFVDGE